MAPVPLGTDANKNISSIHSGVLSTTELIHRATISLVTPTSLLENATQGAGRTDSECFVHETHISLVCLWPADYYSMSYTCTQDVGSKVEPLGHRRDFTQHDGLEVIPPPASNDSPIDPKELSNDVEAQPLDLRSCNSVVSRTTLADRDTLVLQEMATGLERQVMNTTTTEAEGSLQPPRADLWYFMEHPERPIISQPDLMNAEGFFENTERTLIPKVEDVQEQTTSSKPAIQEVDPVVEDRPLMDEDIATTQRYEHSPARRYRN